ncbi:2OG-Fe(II) oxygenase, partial [Sphingomonas sp.]|uniref:2OG-Fe(II) oxygenase n=1 Tax=Sphingomonas sp. TaxID=28214 RepID=UPI002DBCB6A1
MDISVPCLETGLNAQGCAILPGLLSPEICAEARKWWADESLFRSHVHMARHGFGSGEYRYFSYLLPRPVAELRGQLYPPLAAIANRWAERLGSARRFPDMHAAFLEECHAAGQVRPTPLILRYQAG